MINLKKNYYGCILADPPWSFKNFSKKGEKKNPNQHYNCMSLGDIKSLPVSDVAAKDCALIMWATAPMLPQAIDTLEAWGFTYKSGGSWAKQSKTGKKWAFGTGYCYRNASEFFLLGTKGKPKQLVRNIRNLIVAPVREHSRKPDQMKEDLKKLWSGPFLEMFSRENTEGWDSWGNEVGLFNEKEKC